MNPELVPCRPKTKLPARACRPACLPLLPGSHTTLTSVLRTHAATPPSATEGRRLDLDRCARLAILRFDRRSVSGCVRREKSRRASKSWNASQWADERTTLHRDNASGRQRRLRWLGRRRAPPAASSLEAAPRIQGRAVVVSIIQILLPRGSCFPSTWP